MREVYTLRSAEIRARVCARIMALPDLCRVEVKGPSRSLDQNALLWAMLGDISRQVVWYGEKLSSDDWKDVLTASLRRARVVPGIDKGSFVPVGMRTSSMSKAEFSDLVELTSAFGAGHGVVFSAPNYYDDLDTRSPSKNGKIK